MSANPIPELLTVEEIGEMAGVNPRSLSSLIARGVMPEAEGFLGNKALWHRDTVSAWLAARPGTGGVWEGALPTGDPARVADVLAGWVNVDQVAALAGTSPQSITAKVRRGTFLEPAGKVGRMAVWRRADVERFLA